MKITLYNGFFYLRSLALQCHPYQLPIHEENEIHSLGKHTVVQTVECKKRVGGWRGPLPITQQDK